MWSERRQKSPARQARLVVGVGVRSTKRCKPWFRCAASVKGTSSDKRLRQGRRVVAGIEAAPGVGRVKNSDPETSMALSNRCLQGSARCGSWRVQDAACSCIGSRRI